MPTLRETPQIHELSREYKVDIIKSGINTSLYCSLDDIFSESLDGIVYRVFSGGFFLAGYKTKIVPFAKGVDNGNIYYKFKADNGSIVAATAIRSGNNFYLKF